jgi:hypothetical protein
MEGIMIKIEFKIDDIDYLSLADKLIPEKWNNPLTRSVIKFLPAKDRIAAGLVSNQKEKIADKINHYTEKEKIPVKVETINIQKIN